MGQRFRDHHAEVLSSRNRRLRYRAWLLACGVECPARGFLDPPLFETADEHLAKSTIGFPFASDASRERATPLEMMIASKPGSLPRLAAIVLGNYAMKVSIVLGSELDYDLLRRWQEIQLANPELASPYFSAEFTQAVASVSDDVEVAVIEENNKVTALLPFERSGAVGMPVGKTLSDYHGLICVAGLVLDPRELIEKCRLLAWDFDHLLASQDCFSLFHWKYDESPQIDLSRGFDTYTSECHEARRIKRKKRRLECDIGRLRFVVHTSDPSALQQTLFWKAEQLKRLRGFEDLSRGRSRDIIEAILAAQSESFGGMLSVLYAGDRIIAGHFGMRSRTDWHWWFPSYDPTMAKYSPGLILLLEMAKHAASVALRTIDLGKGQMRYKDQFKNATVPLAMGSVGLPSWLNFRRAALRQLKSQILSTPFAPAARLAKREIRRLRYRFGEAVQSRQITESAPTANISDSWKK